MYIIVLKLQLKSTNEQPDRQGELMCLSCLQVADAVYTIRRLQLPPKTWCHGTPAHRLTATNSFVDSFAYFSP